MVSLLRDAGPYSLTKTWYVDGTATDVGSVTVGVVDANGDTVVASGTATTNNANGTYTYELANQSDPTILIVTWTRSDTSASLTDQLEVIGSRLFTEFEARNSTISGQQTPFSDTSTYPDDLISEWHDRIASQFEQKTGRSWILRYARVELSGNGRYGIDLSSGIARISNGKRLKRPGRFSDIGRILSVTVGGTAQTVTDYVVDGTVLHSKSGTWSTPTISDPLNVVVEYEYGIEDDPDANENALRMLHANAIASDLPASAMSWSNEDGSFSRDTSGWAYPTKVFEWLKRNPSRPFA